MNMGRNARLLLAAPVLFGLLVWFLAGCGDFWQAPSGSSTCTTNCTTATGGDFYILDSGTTPQILGESIVSGTLTGISGSPWTLQSVPYAMSMAPSGGFLCVSTTSGVFAYPVSDGSLQTAKVASGDLDALAVQVDHSDSWLVEAIQGIGQVELSAVPIDSATGANAGAGHPATFSITGAAVHQMTISPDNKYIFVALGAGGTLVVPFNASAAAGTSPFGTNPTGTTIPVLNANGTALSVAVDPSSTPRLFYIGETLAGSSGTTGGLRAFNYGSLGNSSLTQASGSPIPSGGLAPNFILPIPSGQYVYIANGTGDGAGNVAGFAITASGTTYSIAAGPTTAAGVQPLGLAEDSSSTFVMAVGSLGSPYLDAYTFDSTTAGQLDSQITSTAAATFIDVVASP
jgi:6-phosphogluconolactonase